MTQFGPKIRGKYLPASVLKAFEIRIAQGPFTCGELTASLGPKILWDNRFKPVEIEYVIQTLLARAKKLGQVAYHANQKQWTPLGINPALAIPEEIGTVSGIDTPDTHTLVLTFTTKIDAARWARFFRDTQAAQAVADGRKTPLRRRSPQREAIERHHARENGVSQF